VVAANARPLASLLARPLAALQTSSARIRKISNFPQLDKTLSFARQRFNFQTDFD